MDRTYLISSYFLGLLFAEGLSGDLNFDAFLELDERRLGPGDFGMIFLSIMYISSTVRNIYWAVFVSYMDSNMQLRVCSSILKLLLGLKS
mgnify:CR=1 FL=1